MIHRNPMMAFGSFEILHAGHIHFFQEVKKKGGDLIVGLYDDALFLKHKRREPVVGEKQRKAVLEAIRYVDRVILINGDALGYVRKFRPKFVVKGMGPTGRTVDRLGCKLKICYIPRLEGESVDGIIRRVLSLNSPE